MKCGLTEQQDVFKVTPILKILWVIKLGESTCFDAWNILESYVHIDKTPQNVGFSNSM